MMRCTCIRGRGIGGTILNMDCPRHGLAASVDTLPKGQDGETRLGAGKGSAVTPKAGDAQ